MYTIRKKFKVEYAHQLIDAYSKACSASIHGHSGLIEIILESQFIDNKGMIMDFGEVKDKIKGIIMQFDHALIMPDTLSKEYLAMLAKYNEKLKIVPYNPTAELMAENIFLSLHPLLGGMLKKVIFHETDTGYASYEM